MFEQLIANLDTTQVRREMLEGEDHLVVPTVMIVEGVLTGNNGPILYPNEENEKSVSSWNHMPIVVYHPKHAGKPVSARQPEVLNSRKVGLVLETTNSDGKLKNESWLNISRLKSVDKRILDKIENKEKVEVSTGLTATVEKREGVFNDKKYTGVARDYQPDHLAILPDQIGACSVADGAGLLANEAKGEPEFIQVVLAKSIMNALKPLGATVLRNEMSFDQIRRSLADQLASKFGEPGRYWDGYICEIYPDSVVFYDDDAMFMMSYVTKDNAAALSGDAKKVERVVTYKTVNGSSSYTANDSGLVLIQNEGATMFDKKAHVTALIANGQIEEADRTIFEAMEDKTLKSMKLIPKAVVNAPPPVTTPPPEKPVITPVVNQAAVPQTLEEWKKNLPPGALAVINQGEKALQQTRDHYIRVIKDNPNNKFSDAALLNMDVDMLAATAEIAKPTVSSHEDDRFTGGWAPSYVGAGGGPVQNAAVKEEPFTTPFINDLLIADAKKN